MITITILTKNSEKTLRQTLDSTLSFKEIILLDTGSTDLTLSIAKEYPNVRLYQSAFEGFGPLRNQAASLATSDWIFALDSDEVLSEGLIEELHSLCPLPEKVYSVERYNYFNEKRIRGCAGWSPDWVARLYNRKHGSFTPQLVHEKLDTRNKQVEKLHHPLHHTPYLEIGDFLRKMHHYTSLFAEESEQKTPSFWNVLLHKWYAFFKSYILRGGFLAGKEGYIISVYNSQTTFYKYLKLSEKRNRRS